MNKAEEIAAWRKFAATMPPAETYSGEWIAEQIEFLEIEFRNDMRPGERARTMADCRAEWTRTQEDAKQTRAAAEEAAERIRARATEEANAIRAAARAQAERTLAAPLVALRKAIAALEN